MDVAPRARAWLTQNMMAAHPTFGGSDDTMVPAAWEDWSGEARVRVPGPEVADAAVTWTTSCCPAS